MTSHPSRGFAQIALLAGAAVCLLGVYLWGRSSTSLSFDPVGHDVFVGLVAAVLFGLMALGPAQSRTTPSRRLALVAMRTAIIALVILVMLRPTLVYRAVTRQAATLLVLVDQSRSMLVADEGSESRWEKMQEALQAAAPTFAELAEDIEVKFYAFDSKLRPLELSDGAPSLPERPEGDESAIGWALAESIQENSGRRLVGQLVVTDGAQRAVSPRDTDPLLAAGRAKDLGYPVHALVLGRSESRGQMRDVAVEQLEANRSVFVKNELTVRGQIRLTGFANQNVPVQLLFETEPGKMEVVATQQVRSVAEGELVPIQMTYAPQTPGEYKLALNVPKREGELVTTNNDRGTYVTVLKGGLRVLYLEGTPPRVVKYLLRALGEAREIEVDFFRLDAEHPRQRHDRVNDAMTQGLEPGQYDVYMLGDLDSQAFLPGELEKLRTAVDRGAGLIMLGGVHSFGPGGYATTPLADVLPIRMDPLERQNFGEPLREDVHFNEPIQLRPSPRAGPQFVTLLTSPEKNEELWRSLPPLAGANRFRGVKDAPVWLESEQGDPMLVAGTYGTGRVLAFAGDSTWRWWTHGYEDAYKRFWRQAILWLAKKDQGQQGQVWAEVNQARVRAGGRVEIAAGAHDPQGNPLPEATFEAEVIGPEGKRQPLRLIRQGETLTGAFAETDATGDYRVVVRATHDGEPLGEAQARFLAFREDLELQRPVADLSAMQRLTALTPGGQTVTPEEFPRLLKELSQAPRELEVEEITKTTLWDRWLVCLLFGALLTGEWYLRKKWGLV